MVETGFDDTVTRMFVNFAVHDLHERVRLGDEAIGIGDSSAVSRRDVEGFLAEVR